MTTHLCCACAPASTRAQNATQYTRKKMHAHTLILVREGQDLSAVSSLAHLTALRFDEFKRSGWGGGGGGGSAESDSMSARVKRCCVQGRLSSIPPVPAPAAAATPAVQVPSKALRSHLWGESFDLACVRGVGLAMHLGVCRSRSLFLSR